MDRFMKIPLLMEWMERKKQEEQKSPASQWEAGLGKTMAMKPTLRPRVLRTRVCN